MVSVGIVVSATVVAQGRRGSSQGARGGQTPLPTTIEDFFQPGTPPDPVGESFEPIVASTNCANCHGYYDEEAVIEPFDTWAASMMAQSARDPVWQAAVTIANQDAPGAGEYCIRCHAPRGWLAGRSATAQIDDLAPGDFDGINCNFCHRMVDPDPSATGGPAVDASILAALEHPPAPASGNARYVIDPLDSRRGPYDDVPLNFHGVPIYHSPFHRASQMCATCHDVSNPVYSRQPDGSYAVNAFDAHHPTQDPYDMWPEQRTYSEWKMSQFANGGVAFPDGRFGGNHPTGIMAECQDCHMPDQFAGGCIAWDTDPFFPRSDMPLHRFAGANTWVLQAVWDMYGSESGMTEETLALALAGVNEMLTGASDLDLSQTADQVNVRVTNWSGHKLPTGYPEGRRMWINVRFFDVTDEMILEHGAYDGETADLCTEDTKVYHAEMGMDDAAAAATGLPAGPSMHLALNNVVLFDNRIPPVGFANAGFESVQAAPVGYTYADGQHWDDTCFDIPDGAIRADVRVYYQTTSKEYAEFLRDTNVTDDRGQIAYDQWVAQGMSAPVEMDFESIELVPSIYGDITGDGLVGLADLLAVIGQWGCTGPECTADVDCDGLVGLYDLLAVIFNWGQSV